MLCLKKRGNGQPETTGGFERHIHNLEPIFLSFQKDNTCDKPKPPFYYFLAHIRASSAEPVSTKAGGKAWKGLESKEKAVSQDLNCLIIPYTVVRSKSKHWFERAYFIQIILVYIFLSYC